MLLPRVLIDLTAPWASYYGDHTGVSATVTYLHLLGLLVGGGTAVAVDRATLRTDLADPVARAHNIVAIRQAHFWVLLGLGLSALSGLLLAAADLETYAGMTLYWVKMGCVALLLINGAWLQRSERQALGEELRPWKRLRVAAGVSLFLWCTIMLLGVLVTTAA